MSHACNSLQLYKSCGTASPHQLLLRRLQRRSSRPAAVQVQANWGRQLFPIAAATAALGMTAITVRHVLVQQRQQQQQPQQGRQQKEVAPPRQRRPQQQKSGGRRGLLLGGTSGKGSSSSNNNSSRGSWLEGLSPLKSLELPSWPLQRSPEQQLLSTLDEIEAQRQGEAQRELQRWDQRLSLRTKTLADLRGMAQQHNIAGRSRMRKRELVAALEQQLGFAPSPQQQPGAGDGITASAARSGIVPPP